jgi:putative oxidoreductase
MKQYHIVSRIAIYLLAVVMIVFGIQHFRHAQDLVVYIPLWVPGGFIWVYFTGAAFILVGLSFLTNRWVKTAAYLLAGLLFIFVLIIHIPNVMDGASAEARANALVNLLKDTAIAGFALHIAAGAHHQQLHLENSD